MSSEGSSLDIVEQLVRKYLPVTLGGICPERKHEFVRMISEDGYKVQFDRESVRIKFTANISTKTITIGIPCLERLWALAYCYLNFHQAMRNARLANVNIASVDVASDPQLKKAAQLLSWALEVDWAIKDRKLTVASPLLSWPDGLPRPIANPIKNSDEDLADNWFLYAVSFIQHHELAHLRLEHSGTTGVDSIEQEKEADREAAEWVLCGFNEDDPKFVVRALGIAVALLWMAGLEVHRGPTESDTHPPGYDRLYQVLNQYVSNPNHVVWWVTQLVLATHYSAKGSETPESMEFGSYRDAVDHFCDSISRSK